MIKDTLGALVRAWNRFFFEPVSAASLGLFRICFGMVVMLSTVGRYPYREIFYGENGIVTSATTGLWFPQHPLLYFRWVPASDPALKYYFIALMIAIAMLIVGLFSRVASVLVFLGIISLSNRNFFIDNAGDDLLRINLFFLMFAPSGAAFSLDRWIRRRRGVEGREIPRIKPWAQRLLQLQLAYLYWDTFYLKLPGEGWQDGTALYYALNYLELRRFNFKYVFYHLWQIKLATYSVMVAEFSAATLIWWRRARYPVILAAFLLHVGINLTMQFPVFQYVMMTSLINFIYPDDIERVIALLRSYVEKKKNLKAHMSEKIPA